MWVEEGGWATVKNPGGIDNITGHFKFGEQGVIDAGGRVTVIGMDGNTNYLVRYTGKTGEERGGGTLLPSGAIVSLPIDKFRTMTGYAPSSDRAEHRIEEERAAETLQ